MYGGKVGEDPGDDVSDNECDAPALSVATPPPDHTSHLRMSDHSGTIDCGLPDLTATRNAMLVPVGPWDLKSGQPVTVQWSPGSDVGPGGIIPWTCERRSLAVIALHHHAPQVLPPPMLAALLDADLEHAVARDDRPIESEIHSRDA
jgi:hypothetical protein